jgi:hypothetical protein
MLLVLMAAVVVVAPLFVFFIRSVTGTVISTSSVGAVAAFWLRMKFSS